MSAPRFSIIAFPSAVLYLLATVDVGQSKVEESQQSLPRNVRLIAFGDINLGRAIGQRLLKGDIDTPFVHIRDSLKNADIVFANLESPLCDRKGETQHPYINRVFCGPPQGAAALKRGNITLVATANNHAYDYGKKGLFETIENLEKEGIAFIGTKKDSSGSFRPFIFEHEGIRIGFVAYTQFVNLKGSYRNVIALFDTGLIRKDIGSLRDSVDFIIASFHGGIEDRDKPSPETMRQMKVLIDAGADLVLGHHPHVPQGIFLYKNKLIVASMGNFVFSQEGYWEQRGFGVDLELQKDSGKTTIATLRLLPVKAGFIPEFLTNPKETDNLLKRLQTLSNIEIKRSEKEYFFEIHRN